MLKRFIDYLTKLHYFPAAIQKFKIDVDAEEIISLANEIAKGSTDESVITAFQDNMDIIINTLFDPDEDISYPYMSNIMCFVLWRLAHVYANNSLKFYLNKDFEPFKNASVNDILSVLESRDDALTESVYTFIENNAYDENILRFYIINQLATWYSDDYTKLVSENLNQLTTNVDWCNISDSLAYIVLYNILYTEDKTMDISSRLEEFVKDEYSSASN